MGESGFLAWVFVLLVAGHCVALFVTGWGHVVADWWRERFGRHG